MHPCARPWHLERILRLRGFVAGLWLAGALAPAAALLPALAHASALTVVRTGTLPTSADKRLHTLLAAHRGRPVVINFWATWCEPCREEMPALQRLAERWRERGLAVVTVAVADNPRRIESFFLDSAIDLPVIDDREQAIGRAWRARVLPTTVILDRRHRIRLRGMGPIDWDAAAVEQQLQALFNQPRRHP